MAFNSITRLRVRPVFTPPAFFREAARACVTAVTAPVERTELGRRVTPDLRGVDRLGRQRYGSAENGGGKSCVSCG